MDALLVNDVSGRQIAGVARTAVAVLPTGAPGAVSVAQAQRVARGLGFRHSTGLCGRAYGMSTRWPTALQLSILQ